MSDHKALLEKLAACAAACEHCMNACLEEDDVKMMENCIKTDRDCAKICQLTASFVAADSPFQSHILEICEKICRQCAEECGSHDHDHCQECARACEDCAEACAVAA